MIGGAAIGVAFARTFGRTQTGMPGMSLTPLAFGNEQIGRAHV